MKKSLGSLGLALVCGLGSVAVADVTTAMPISQENVAAGADATVAPTGSLVVQLVDADGVPIDTYQGSPLGVSASLYDPNTLIQVVSGYTHAEPGVVEVTEIPPGSYLLIAGPASGNYVTELYPDILCPWDRCDLSQGAPIEILSGQTTRLTMEVERAVSLLAVSADRLTGIPGEDVTVEVYDASGAWITSRYVGMGGTRVVGLPEGTYYAVLTGPAMVSQVWGGGDCVPPDACNPLTGAPIEARVDGEEPRLDFDPRVVRCGFSNRETCLGDDRFRVVARWEDAAKNVDYSWFSRLTDDSETLWFFARENTEGVVKVLDACDGPSNRFWVFAAGLTDVQVTLWVTDTATDETRIYQNPPGQAFLPIQDTDAFDTCGADVSQSPAASSPPTAFEPAPSKRPKACAPASGSLCLGNGRFSVEAYFRTDDGPEQQAPAEFLTDDSGYFWFFDADNVEILAKVLDGCDLNERFWVFGAGLTDVEVRLRVTDTETGEVREYVNEQGNAFIPVQDTAAFDACF